MIGRSPNGRSHHSTLPSIMWPCYSHILRTHLSTRVVLSRHSLAFIVQLLINQLPATGSPSFASLTNAAKSYLIRFEMPTFCPSFTTACLLASKSPDC